MSLELRSLGDIVFSRLIRPSSMRSSYWTYFGFPADAQNQIITRRKIVCTLCNTAIAYNRNTTNLKVHLSARHPDVDVGTQPKLKRVKYVYQPVDEDGEELDEVMGDYRQATVETSDELDHIDLLIETDPEELFKQENMLHEIDDEDASVSRGYEIEYVDEVATVAEADSGPLAVDDMEKVAEQVRAIDRTAIDQPEEGSEVSKDEALTNFLFSNMMNSQFVNDSAFQKFCSVLNYRVPEKYEVNSRGLFN